MGEMPWIEMGEKKRGPWAQRVMEMNKEKTGR